MTRIELAELMNSDLRNEYKHMLFYLHSSVMVRGLHRQPIQAFLMQEAQSEINHVVLFSKKVRSLGGIPVAEANEFPTLENPRDILEYALKMEEEVVANYAKRIDQADKLGGPDGINIRLFYEGQLEDSHTDMDEVREMIAGLAS